MDAFVKRCEHCGEPVPETKRGRPQRFCSDAHRQAHRKINATPGNGLRYRTSRVKPKEASQDSDSLREFKPENLSLKTKLHFERVNEITFKLTDGEVTNVPASHGQWGGYRTTKAVASVINIAPGRWLARCRDEVSRIQSTTSTDCKLACSTATGRRSDGSSESICIEKLGRCRNVS